MGKQDNRLVLHIKGLGNYIICTIDKTLSTKDIKEALVRGLEELGK